jgi:hypothetical protein
MFPWIAIMTVVALAIGATLAQSSPLPSPRPAFAEAEPTIDKAHCDRRSQDGKSQADLLLPSSFCM